MVGCQVSTKYAYLWSHVTLQHKENKPPSTPTTMPPKNIAEHVVEMMVQQAQLNKELAQAKEEVTHEEKQCTEEAMWEK